MELVLRGETDARQHLLAVPGRRACGSAGQRLGDGGRGRRVVFPCRAQHGVRRLDGDERLGQAMAHRLELADELTELSSLQCVSPGQLQHLPGGADQFIPHGQLAQRDQDGHAVDDNVCCASMTSKAAVTSTSSSSASIP